MDSLLPIHPSILEGAPPKEEPPPSDSYDGWRAYGFKLLYYIIEGYFILAILKHRTIPPSLDQTYAIFSYGLRSWHSPIGSLGRSVLK